MKYNLQRFIDAQDKIYPTVIEELKNGKKQSHWIWFIFPQVKGLGYSYNSNYYGLDGEDEAIAYLQNETLSNRLFECCQILLTHKGTDICEIMGNELDSIKLCSSMEIFDKVCPQRIFRNVFIEFFPHKLKKNMLKDCILSAVIGDIAGQPYEFKPCKDYKKIDIYRTDSRFTDDSVCTMACAESYLEKIDITLALARRTIQHINAGYAGMFLKWILSVNKQPYNSWGNGSAMRCSIAGWVGKSPSEVAKIATATAVPTHNHPEGIKGAVAIAMAIYSARTGESKEDIRKNIVDILYPDYSGLSYSDIQPTYKFEVSCQKSVPVAIICFLDSENFEDCLKKCIATGGDADTLCAMAAPIAYAYYKEMPEQLVSRCKAIIPKWMNDINDKMNNM